MRNLPDCIRETDWDEISAQFSEKIQIGQTVVPYAIFENEDDITSGNDNELGKRLELVLNELWDNYKSIRSND